MPPTPFLGGWQCVVVAAVLWSSCELAVGAFRAFPGCHKVGLESKKKEAFAFLGPGEFGHGWPCGNGCGLGKGWSLRGLEGLGRFGRFRAAKRQVWKARKNKVLPSLALWFAHWQCSLALCFAHRQWPVWLSWPCGNDFGLGKGCCERLTTLAASSLWGLEGLGRFRRLRRAVVYGGPKFEKQEKKRSFGFLGPLVCSLATAGLAMVGLGRGC